MNILVIEDDPIKRNAIAVFVTELYPNAQVGIAGSYQSGLRDAILHGPDVIVVDMSMPTFDVTAGEGGGEPQWYAGREILRQLKLRGLSRRAIVVTSFESFGDGTQEKTLEELMDELREEFSPDYVGTVFYQPSRGSWRPELESLLSRAYKGLSHD